MIGPLMMSFFNLFISFLTCWVFIAMHGLALVLASRGPSLAAVSRLLITAASLVGEQGLQGRQASVLVTLVLSCTEACGILWNQG